MRSRVSRMARLSLAVSGRKLAAVSRHAARNASARPAGAMPVMRETRPAYAIQVRSSASGPRRESITATVWTAGSPAMVSFSVFGSGPLPASSARAEQHNRNVALGPGLVRVVLGPLRRHDRPDAPLVLGRPGAGPDGEDLVPHLDLDVGVRDQVPVPSGVFGRSTLRCHDDVVITVPTIDERELPGLAGLPTGRVQDEAVGAIPVVTHLAARRFVLPDVLVTKEAVVRHAVRVPRPRRGSDPPSRDDDVVRNGHRRHAGHVARHVAVLTDTLIRARSMARTARRDAARAPWSRPPVRSRVFPSST